MRIPGNNVVQGSSHKEKNNRNQPVRTRESVDPGIDPVNETWFVWLDKLRFLIHHPSPRKGSNHDLSAVMDNIYFFYPFRQFVLGVKEGRISVRPTAPPGSDVLK